MPLWLFTLGILHLIKSFSRSQIHEQAVLYSDDSPDLKVPVVLGVMSKCPDARDCEGVFDSVLRKVGNITDLQLSFIGTVNDTEPKYGVTCKHGESECLLNIQELCAIEYYPIEQWWPFVMCLNIAEDPNKEAKACGIMNGIDWVLMEGCMIGRGRGLLIESVTQSGDLEITTSCTILINGERRCIRDDGQWKQCSGGHKPSDFADSILEEYERINR